MRFTLLSSCRAMSYSALALASAIVACDSQDAVAPVASAPTAPSLAVGGAKNTLTIYIVDQTGAQVTTGVAQFLVQNTNTGNGFFTLDNNYNDADNSTFGRILITGLVAGTYSICQNNQAPAGYMLPTTPCQTAIVGGIVAGKVTFVNPTVPRVKFMLADMLNRPVGGGTLKVWDGLTWGTLTDNAAGDLDPTPGRFEMKAPLNNGYTICPLTPPTGWVNLVSTCIGLPTAAGETVDFGGMGVAPEYSFYFSATDYVGPVGPSSYLVTNAAGFSKKLTDEGLNDFWNGEKGKLWMKLPSDGEYQICQTVAPPNTELADPACKTIRVSFGQITWAGLFVSKPLY
jgi:hypothetical protein